MHKHKMVFEGNGEDFSAHHEAEKFIRDNGGSYGSMERGAPIGVIMKKDVLISKWRNLSKQDRASLDGVLESGRNAPATLFLYVDLPNIK
jgi:hypothetical protein